MNTPIFVVPLPSQSPVTGVAPAMPKWIVLMGTPLASASVHCDWFISAPVHETGSKYALSAVWVWASVVAGSASRG